MIRLRMFVSLSREDVNGLSEDVGIQMTLRTAQTLVKGELISQETSRVVNPAPPAFSVEGRNRERLAESGVREPGIPSQEQPVITRDNLDPYFVSQSVNTPSGRHDLYKLNGQQERGVATEKTRLPSTCHYHT
jgi:hypothetical protein